MVAQSRKVCNTKPVKLKAAPQADELAKLAWALAHPARVQIMRFLQEQQGCMCAQIVSSLPLAQSTVSQHLKILKEAGLIQGEVDGPRVCYCVNDEVLKRLKQLIGGL